MRAFVTASTLCLFMILAICFLWLVPALTVPDHVDNPQHLKDSLKLALQLGRLDWVVGILSAIAILLALAGLFSFAYINKAVVDAAERVASDRIDELLPDMVAKRVADHMEILGYTDSKADEIAKSFGQSEDG